MPREPGSYCDERGIRPLDKAVSASDNSSMTASVPRLPFSIDPLIAEAKRRMRRRRLLSGVLLALVATGTATAVIATRSPAGANSSLLSARWQGTQICRNGGMALTANQQPFNVVGLVSARMRVSMSFATASSIAQRTGPQELQPAGTHSATPRVVPCNVAGAVADTAGNTWSVRHQRQFAIKAGWVGYAAGPFFRFTCVLRNEGPSALAGTCLHKPSRQAGTVRVRFLIHRA